MSKPELSAERINYTVFVPQDDFGENLTLFKYREVNQRALCSLILNQVYLSRPEDFNDPFEAIKEFDGALFSGEMRKRLERDIREAGILCLCRTAKNLAMWSYYGNGLRGFAVGYDLKCLLETLAPVNPAPEECTPRWSYIYTLAYCSKQPEPVNENILVHGSYEAKGVEWRKMFASKSTTFEHEDEYRVVVPPSSDDRSPWAWQGHGLYQHHPDAIAQIVFGELLPSQDEAAIRGIMAGRNVCFLRAKRVAGEFRVELEDAS